MTRPTALLVLLAALSCCAAGLITPASMRLLRHLQQPSCAKRSGLIGEGSLLPVTLDHTICTDDAYHPSTLEVGFLVDANNATQYDDKPTAPLPRYCENQSWVWSTDNWLAALKGIQHPGPEFSHFCKDGQPPQLIEPLAGILRDPRFPCESRRYLMSIDWLLPADRSLVKPNGRRILFDAGGSRFMEGTGFLTSAYAARGVVFDEIHVWDATWRSTECYWGDVTQEVRGQWEPRLVWHNGVKVTAEPGAEHNVVELIWQKCQPEDFCVFKLDIDTADVELALVQSLLDNPGATSRSLDEIFWEHHVHGVMEHYGWGGYVKGAGTFADSYRIFTQLRKMGVRAHSWV